MKDSTFETDDLISHELLSVSRIDALFDYKESQVHCRELQILLHGHTILQSCQLASKCFRRSPFSMHFV